MTITEAQFDKLPRYAADEISQLRREIDYLKGQIAGLTADPAGASIVWRSLMNEYALPNGVEVTFRHDNTSIECRMDESGNLRIYGHGGRRFIVKPMSGNAIYVKCERE